MTQINLRYNNIDGTNVTILNERKISKTILVFE